MDDYIRRGEAIEQFEDSTSAIPEKLARIRIKEIPAADVVEVRHGKWERTAGNPYPYCSECGCESLSRVDRPYCQFCGARMDGDEDGKKAIPVSCNNP